MALKFKIDTLEGIPEGQKSLYKKVGDSFQLDLDVEIKTEEDIKKLQEVVTKERLENKEAKKKLADYKKTPQEIQEMEDQMEELKIKANKIDDDAINKLVSVRVNPIAREKERVQKELQDALNETASLKSKLNETKLETSLRSVADGKVHPLSVQDAILRAKNVMKLNPDDDKFYTEAGLSMEKWLEEEIPKTNWGIGSSGTGAKGKGFTGSSSFEFNGTVFNAKNNPFVKGKENLTEQSIIMKNNPTFGAELQKLAEEK